MISLFLVIIALADWLLAILLFVLFVEIAH